MFPTRKKVKLGKMRVRILGGGGNSYAQKSENRQNARKDTRGRRQFLRAKE